jgi:molecular chaperone GrpE
MSNETENTVAGDQPDLSSAGSGAPEELIPAQWTDEQVAQWKEQAAKAQENWDRLVRVSADFDNFKKRAARERQDAVRFANESLIQKLIPVLDNFEMALATTTSGPDSSSEALKTGVSMIHSQLRSALTDAGLEEIDATGQPFDPNWHEAVAQQPSTEVPEGHVLQQTRRGFKLKDRLIRPATVIVAKKPTA